MEPFKKLMKLSSTKVPFKKSFKLTNKKDKKYILNSRIIQLIEYGVVHVVADDIHAEYPSQVDLL